METIENTGWAEKSVRIGIERNQLEGVLTVPDQAHGIVVFAHGSGSSRHSPRNQRVAEVLNEAGIATLLMNLLTVEERAFDQQTQHLRFDIAFLSSRLKGANAWLKKQPETADLPLGFFGASTGAGAALVTAAACPDDVFAVVSRAGRIDMAGKSLPLVKAPTLLIVGGADVPVIDMNRQAQAKMTALTEMQIVPRATHLFEEPGTLDEVAQLATDWFGRYLRK
jgi:dienelactone hydrolase